MNVRGNDLNQAWAYNFQRLTPYDFSVSITGQDGNVESGSRVVVDRGNGDAQRWVFDEA